MDERFPGIFEFNATNKDFILSALTIPAIKADFIEDENDFAFAKQLLITECKKFKSNVSIAAEPEVELNSTNGNSKLISFSSRRNHRSNSVEQEVESEVNRYLQDTDQSYNILNSYPLIREVFYAYNTTLSSSAAVERIFSQCLLIFTARRNRISPENFEKAVLLKHNNSLID